MTTLAIVGPGRLGCALGRRLHEAGLELLGFVGRSRGSAQRAVEFCGAGDVLRIEDALTADVCLLSVGDDELTATVDALLAAGMRAPEHALWLHASGFHDRDVLAQVATRRAVLHPLCPIPKPHAGYHALEGAPATIDASEADADALHDLATRAGLQPLPLRKGADRRAYHAACALAANGATALHDLVASMFAAVMERQDADRAASALIGQAAQLSGEGGARAALSGPVPRGDRGVIAAHLDSFEDAPTRTVYAALMSRAVDMAESHGTLDCESAAALRALLVSDG